MITDFEYEVLKRFKDSKDGITYKEFTEIEGDGYTNRTFRHLETNDYIIMNFKVWKNRQAFILTEKGNKAILFYEKWLSYPHTCEQTKKTTGAKYVIVEHRSGCFGTGVYHMGYTGNLGFTNDFSHAELYDSKEKAEEALAEAIKDSPTKYQNPKDYEFSIEEVKLILKIELPKTFICKDCGKVFPIERYNISTYCPRSWNTGVCNSCIGHREAKEREEMYGRNKRGVFDYDSID